MLKRLQALELNLANWPTPLHISLGENCGCGVKLRAVGASSLGSSFFDNIVVDRHQLIRLIDCDFSDILMDGNLRIGSWEGQDSVKDHAYDCFYHHYFYKAGHERRRSDGTRLIEFHDIATYLPEIREQFLYLAEKFRRIVRSSVWKMLHLRRVNGEAVEQAFQDELSFALRSFGARNFHICFVTNEMIPEHGVRWGPDEVWQDLVQKNDELVSAL